MAIPVVAAQALHVSGAELTELTGEDAVRGATRCRARGHVTAGGQLIMTELLTNVCWLQVRRTWETGRGKEVCCEAACGDYNSFAKKLLIKDICLISSHDVSFLAIKSVCNKTKKAFSSFF